LEPANTRPSLSTKGLRDTSVGMESGYMGVSEEGEEGDEGEEEEKE
jgi:hypothetical protein